MCVCKSAFILVRVACVRVSAFLLQGGVLLLLTYCVACVIVIPVVYGYGDFFIQWFMNWW